MKRLVFFFTLFILLSCNHQWSKIVRPARFCAPLFSNNINFYIQNSSTRIYYDEYFKTKVITIAIPNNEIIILNEEKITTNQIAEKIGIIKQQFSSEMKENFQVRLIVDKDVFMRLVSETKEQLMSINAIRIIYGTTNNTFLGKKIARKYLVNSDTSG